MPGVSWIEYKTSKILFIDFKGCKSEKEMLDVLSSAQYMIQESQDGYLQLSDVSSVHATPQFMKILKKTARETPKVASKRAIVGITNHARRILLQTYSLILGTDSIKTFNDLEEAKNWLVS